MRRGFSFIEVIVVVAMVGAIAAMAMIGIGPVIERARRDDQTRSALAQIRKVRAQALLAGEGAAVDVDPIGGATSGVRITTATIPRTAGMAQCASYLTRATRIETREYSMLDITVPRTDSLLCFSSDQFSLLGEDGLALAPVVATIEFANEDGAVFGDLKVSPEGTLDATFETTLVKEGAAMTDSRKVVPADEDPRVQLLRPLDEKAELSVVGKAPPAAPTTPTGEFSIEALPLATLELVGPACASDSDCEAGFQCLASVCESLGARCASDCDCPADATCVAGTCDHTSFACNTCSCPKYPSCSMMCQNLNCCMDYGCLCY